MTVAERMRRYGFRRSSFFGWIVTYKRRWISVNENGLNIPVRFCGDSSHDEPSNGRSVVALALLAKAVARKMARRKSK